MTYSAPTNLDLSGCNVTPTGGSTSQTIADLAKTVADGNTNIATAVQNATTAKTTAQTAQTTATAASTAVSNLGNVYIPISAYQEPNGPAQYTPDGLTYCIIPKSQGMPQIAMGSLGTSNAVIHKIFAGGTGTDIDNSYDACWYYRNGTSKSDGGVTLKAAALASEVDGGTALGTASNRWNGIYSNSGTIQTSDANEKTVVGVLGDTHYADSAKLIAAGTAIRKAITVFTFNDDGTRKHVGAIAQNVQSALTNAGLNPADFGVWCQDALTENVEVKDEKGIIIDYKQQPILDEHGNQKYRQSLRYDELAMLLIAAGEAESQANAAALTALTNRVTALEVKAGA